MRLSFSARLYQMRHLILSFVVLSILLLAFCTTATLISTGPLNPASPSPSDDWCRTGQSCFPNVNIFDAFNRSVNGRLFAERPLAAVCYRESCRKYGLSALSGPFRADHFSSYQYAGWESCSDTPCVATTITNGSCDQGNVPNYSVHAQDAEDVRRYVQFATAHKLRIVVKNTGHDLSGRSIGYGGVAVWTHKLKNIQLHERFVPKGCSEVYEGAMTLGSGVQWVEAYTFAHNHSRYIVGGLATSVGSAGGYVMGGGHSLLTPSFGLGADNLISMDIVTADGVLRAISQCHHSDLFWAVRGGGGGTWGVVTSATYRTRAASSIHVASFTVSLDFTSWAFKEILASFVKIQPRLSELGVGGATTLTPGSLQALLLLPSSQGNLTQLRESLRPLTQLMTQYGILTPDMNLTADGQPIYREYSDWYNFYVPNFGTSSDAIMGGTGGTASRILPAHYFIDGPTNLTDVIYSALDEKMRANDYYPVIIGHAGPGQVKEIQTSVNPIWYKSLWHVVSSESFVKRLRDYTPDGAVYFGESSLTEPNHTKAYWGENYERLLQVKRRWDPENHFQVWHGVGAAQDSSDRWKCYSRQM
ncbi:hypothetical protein PROFUN_08525 [Planoprotostelium fungivorum]|uniref:FAD-binding PCMH-type domain-containing protein n=1 Tax=Planoprotostelium fungivorum TaxID=1890364 RepID=A0A2P6NJC1_9EUKA|nr:hypothetical protein PROFUN_08525 [Planoprotostelium fungivorum]